MIFYLVIDIIVLLLQITDIISNGFILFAFVRKRTLRQGSSIRLLLYLTLSNVLHALTTLPYSIYLTVSWNSVQIILNPYYTLISGIPNILQMKIDLTLTICLAIERILIMGIIVIILTISILIRLQIIQKRTQLNRDVYHYDKNKFKKSSDTKMYAEEEKRSHGDKNPEALTSHSSI
ncbi:hypothetical protein DICVIV_12728 [Dictyocaulus viviparus]|uniref:G-protein coupled receptors family 1 profile domain-containing protein n=1 Tax=Dictyocaulus viviparus TaxID=29172 RepID=A0A0D8XC21_DICVI|nr:hypothetical protein DICVIV_12728 [Dictyocaulus viviparus]